MYDCTTRRKQRLELRGEMRGGDGEEMGRGGGG